jgi:lipopolysaccharide export system permease protein
MFMLVLQFTWLYIDDLMGKNLGVLVLGELLFYVSARLIPLALPLAILLSSIMTLGNLAESNELTAMKSSGMSLLKIMRPLTQFVVILSIITFFFSNYLIPVANLKFQTILYDIQSTKVNTLLTPGTFSNNIDGYSIKVKSGDDNSFKGVTIIDYTDASTLKTVKAERGTVFTATDGKMVTYTKRCKPKLLLLMLKISW